jgi:hypothetical protein
MGMSPSPAWLSLSPELLLAAPLAWRQLSARAKLAVAYALAPHLLECHFRDERIEICAREILANVL